MVHIAFGLTMSTVLSLSSCFALLAVAMTGEGISGMRPEKNWRGNLPSPEGRK